MTDITNLIIKVESQGIAKTEKELAGLEAQGAKTERATDALAKTSKDTGKALEDVAASATKSGESAEQAASRIHKMVQASLAAKAAAGEQNLSERALAEQQLKNTATTVGYNSATKARVAAQNEAMGSLEGFLAAESASTAEHVAATGAIKAETEATLGLAFASGGAVREYTALLDEVISGRTSRMPGTFAVLGSRLGLTQKLFSATGLAALGTVAAIGGLVAVTIKAEEEQDKFNKAVRLTGGYLGVTDGQFRQMAEDLTSGNVTIGQSKEALLEVANTGRFTGNQLETVGKGVAAMAEVTGKSVKDVVGEFVKIADDPVKASEALDRQYHFLTASVYDQIAALESEGRTEEAAQVAIQGLSDAMSTRAKNAEQSEGTVIRWVNREKKAWSALWDQILNIGNPAAEAKSKLSDLKSQIFETQAEIFKAQRHGGYITTPSLEVITEADLQKKLDALRKEAAAQQKVIDGKKESAAAQAELDKENAAYVSASASVHQLNIELDHRAKMEAALLKLQTEKKNIEALANNPNASAADRSAAQDLLNKTDWDKLYKEIKDKYLATEKAKQDADLKRFNEGIAAAAEHYKKLDALRAKDLSKLKASLLTSEEAVTASYVKRYNEILRLTKAGSPEQSDMLQRLFQQYGDKATAGLESGGPKSFADKERAIQDEFERERAAVLANTRLTENQKTQLILRLTKDRNKRVAALENQRDVMQLGASARLFDSLAGLAKTFAGKQSAAYKTLFAISKGYSIAQSLIAIKTGIANAFELPYPENLAAAATVISETAGIVSDIKGTNFSGAYDSGGFIPGGSVGLVGEVGPELVSGPAQVTSRAETARKLGGTFAPVVNIDARGAGPDEVAKLAEMRKQLVLEMQRQYTYFQKYGHFPAAA